jgi:hypothetical protein
MPYASTLAAGKNNTICFFKLFFVLFFGKSWRVGEMMAKYCTIPDETLGLYI